MSDQAGSPFAGLDKALLRSTQPRPNEATVPPEAETQDVPAPAAPKPPKARKAASQPRPAPTPVPTAGSDSLAEMQQTLKTIGKEIYYVRVTPDEKARIEDVIHALKRRGLRTSANELGRIALNQLLADYEDQGEESVLVRMLLRMRS